MAKEEWLAARLDYLRGLKSPSAMQKLLLELATKEDRNKKEQREFDALIRLERINIRAEEAKSKASKILQEKAETDRKARNHRLVVQGALVDLAGLELIDRGILVGGLMQLADQLKSEGPKLEAVLKARGDALLASREKAT